MKVYEVNSNGNEKFFEKNIYHIIDWLKNADDGDIITIKVIKTSQKEFAKIPCDKFITGLLGH